MSTTNGNGNPSANGVPAESNGNGKDPKSGQFVKGNTYGRGGPIAALAVRLRRAMLEAITPTDMANATQNVLDIATGAKEDADLKLQLAAFKVLADAINSSKAAADVDIPDAATADEVGVEARKVLSHPDVALAVQKAALSR